MTAALQDSGFRVTRIQKNLIARRERIVLNWICGRLPGWVTPDGLTALGVFGAVLIFASYIASRFEPAFLWLASAGFIVHWFGDSLDGSLARHRRIERPVYGYFLDHTVDAICNVLIMTGLGFTAYVRMDSALFALIGYLLLCIYVFINNHLSGIFRLSMIGAGPTELRIGLIGLNTAMFYVGRAGFTVGHEFVSIYDAMLIGAGLLFVVLFLWSMTIGIRQLRATGSLRKPAPAQIASPNASSAPK